MSDILRTFIAIDIPFNEKMNECYNYIYQALKEEKIKMETPKNLHLTIKFLGPTNKNLLSQIINSLKEISQESLSFKIVIKEIGIFKNINDPKVIWFGIEKNIYLEKLKMVIDDTLDKYGFDIENRIFSPHLTIGRIMYIRNKQILKELFERFKNQQLNSLTIRNFVFYNSILMPEGAMHNVIERFNLGFN